MIKQFSGLTIWSEDLNNLLPFYRDVLGLKVAGESPGFVLLVPTQQDVPTFALGTHSEVHGRNADPARHMVGLESDNLTAELKLRSLKPGNKTVKIFDESVSVGGPIMRDKLWFFASWRRIATDSVIPGSYFANTGEVGTGVEEQWIMNNMLRLTWQVNQKNKFSAYYDRYPKFKGHEMGALVDLVGCP